MEKYVGRRNKTKIYELFRKSHKSGERRKN
jgi:hypothetical protein